MSSRLYKSITATEAGKELLEYVFDDKNNWGISADVNSDCLACGGDTYELLAKIIPKNRVVYDFGAAYGFQAWWFRHHRRYLAIDPFDNPFTGETVHFRTDNSIWLKMTVQEFFKKFTIEEDSFAICNYVPDEEAQRLVRENCHNVFNNYVTGGDCKAIFKRGGK